MKKLILFLVLCCFLSNINAQDFEKESYYPLEVGMSKTLIWYNSKYREVIKDTVNLKGKLYTKISQIFPPNKTIDIYLRNSNDTIYFFNEVKLIGIPFFGINPEIGETIGNGTIKKLDAKLKTPEGKLSGLLVIEMNYSNGVSDTRYYKKGLGLVAVKNRNKLICYYVPD